MMRCFGAGLLILTALLGDTTAQAQAAFPFSDGFESGVLSNYWTTNSTATGRIRILTTSGPFDGLRHVALDSANIGTYALNELVLTVDLSGRSNVFFDCWVKDYYDDPEVMPAQFTGSTNAEGIAVSTDGITWHKVTQFIPTYPASYSNILVDLSALAASRGLTFNSQFKIKFQQYDYYTLEGGGFTLDNVQLYDRSQAADLVLSLSDSMDPVAVGSNLTYSILVSNTGPAQAENVILTNRLPAGVTLLSVQGSQGTWTTNGQLIAADLGSLAAGALATFTLVVQPNTVGIITNTAQVVTSTFEPQSWNNSRSETTRVDLEGGDLRFSPAAYFSEENRGAVAVTVIRTGHVAGVVSFDYATEDGTATAGVDYVSSSSTVSMANGVTNLTFFIPVIDDETPESEESFSVRLSQPTGGARLVSPSNAVITLRDEDGIAALPFEEGFETGVFSNYWETYTTGPGGPEISTNDSPHGGFRHVNMNGGPLSYSLNELILSADLSGRVGVYLRFWHKRLQFEQDDFMNNSFANHAYADGVALSVNGTQWYKVSGLGAAEAGTNEYRQFDIPLDPILAANGLNYTNRVFIKFQLYGYYYPPYYGRFFDDVSLYTRSGDLRFSATTWEVPEGFGAVTLAVERVQGDSGTVSVDFTTSNGTAQAGADYTDTSGTLVFTNGVHSQTIVVPVTPDTDDEPPEDFFVLLSHPTGGAGLASPTQAEVIIVDDDGPGEITFSADAYSEVENNGLASIAVDRRYGREGDVSIQYLTQAGTATAGVDYIETTGTLYFADGVIQQFFEVPLIDDALQEGPETVRLILRDPGGGAVAGALTNVLLTILDDEAPRAGFPFYEGFETGVLSNYWSLKATGPGRMVLTNTGSLFEGARYLAMDSGSSNALNEAILTVDLSGQTSVIFRCWTKDFGDAPHPMPATFNDSTNADGIAVSANGITWHRLADLPGSGVAGPYTNIVMDLAAFAAQRGLPLTPTFQIKFQQFDSNSIPARGRAFDHISLTPQPSPTSGVIRFQGFEGGANDNWDFGIAPKTGRIELTPSRQYSGTRSARLIGSNNQNADPYLEFDNVNIASFNNVFLTVAFSCKGPDSGDDLYLDISYDNGLTWTGAGSVKLIDGFSNADIPFGGTNGNNPTTVATNPYTVNISSGHAQIKARLRFDELSGSNASLDTNFVDHIVLGYSLTNQPPRLAHIGDRTALVSNQLAFAVSADDNDHDVITLSISNLPPGAQFDALAGPGPISTEFRFTPDVSQADAVYVVTFTATDKDGQDSETLAIRVLDKVVTFRTNSLVTTEEAGQEFIAVALSRSADAVVQLTAAGSATVGTNGDFTLSSTSLVFTADGPSEQTVVMQINDDTLPEGVEQTRLTVTNSPGVTFGSPPLEVVIRDNDSVTLATANLTSGGSFYYTGPGQRILDTLLADVVAIQEFNVQDAGGYRAFVDTHFGTNYSYYVEPGKVLPNGIISRWPILAAGEWEDPQVSDREFAWARINLPGGHPMHVVSVHLHYSGGVASRQTEGMLLTNYLAQAGLNTSDYVVLCGDFNTQTLGEPVVQILTTALRNDRRPADQFGDTDTNQGRDKPYDFILPTPLMNERHRLIQFGGLSFPEGVVFDTRIWGGAGPPAPALALDSAALNMQHMAVMKLFALDPLVTIFTHAGAGGSITPVNPQVAVGSNLLFTLTADPFFHISGAATNGSAWTPTGPPTQQTWVWSNVLEPGTLEVSFAEDLVTNDVPQRWLAGYQLTNQPGDLEALADPDLDGMLTWQEYLADTDPTNRNSLFEIRQVEAHPLRTITFVSSTARVYSVEYLADPAWTSAWIQLLNHLGGSNQITTVADTNSGPFRIYRIDVSKP